ncbi:afadin- and alpha-actinin-binding protein isoform X1 [Pygocentrus nattereri]|uniref:afadin- and alpha-actinin-binding protein isoform X1 n=2 Tax=Pygocentrus nattereri TaxID=42514 RepID=UPI0008144118|nr:afadin- and alpha-actinin-binding protein isoform X1 [Pygocentrus nattereri]
MPESSYEDINIYAYSTMPPSRQYSQSAMPLLPVSPYSGPSDFCTEENISECMLYISQELSSLGLPSIFYDLNGIRQLDVMSTLNRMYDLLQLHRRAMGVVEELEVEQLKVSSDLHCQQLTSSKLKDQLELSKKENVRLRERERQLETSMKMLQTCLKNEKEEVQKLQNIIASRATQYNHEMKRKEKEFSKLKESLNRLLTDKKDKKQGMEVLNYLGRSDGRRSQWKTGKTDGRHEREMYKTLLNEFDKHQKELMLENAELKKVLQQMKQEMVGILSPKRHSQKEEKSTDFTDQQIPSDDEETSEMSCEHAREKLTNSIRQQWRKLKNHVENLDNKASMVQLGKEVSEEMISKQLHQEEMERLKMEIQQCRDFIRTQQQLLQQQLNTPCDEETAAVLNDCYMLEEKERLKEEWRTFDEQRKNFEMERRSFTEAAIRLGHERKMFEEDRATWLKHQFLNITFTDQMKMKTQNSLSEYSVQEQKHSSGPKTPL